MGVDVSTDFLGMNVDFSQNSIEEVFSHRGKICWKITTCDPTLNKFIMVSKPTVFDQLEIKKSLFLKKQFVGSKRMAFPLN